MGNFTKRGDFWSGAVKKPIKAPSADGLLSSISGGTGGGSSNRQRPNRSSTSQGITPKEPKTAQQNKKEGGEKNSFEKWALKKGIDLVYDEYGKPLFSEALFDMYMSEVAGVTVQTGADGSKHYVDENGKDVTDSTSDTGARAASAAATAGMTSLWNAYLKNGKLESKDYTAAVAKSGFSGAKEYSKDWFKGSDYGKSAGFSGLHSGAWAGAGSIAGDLAAGEDVKYDRAALAAASAGGQEYVARTAAQNAAQQGASNEAAKSAGSSAGAVAGAWSSAAMYFYGRNKAKTYGEKERAGGAAPFLSMMGSVAGSTLGGPIGGMAGGIIGGMVGGNRDRARDKYVYSYAGNNQPIVYNPKTGQFEANQVTDVRRYSEQNGVAQRIGFTDGEPPERWIQGQQERAAENAKILNERMSKFDNLSVVDQLSLLDAMDGVFPGQAVYRNEQGEVIDAEHRINPALGTENAYLTANRPGTMNEDLPANFATMSFEDQQKWRREHERELAGRTLPGTMPDNLSPIEQMRWNESDHKRVEDNLKVKPQEPDWYGENESRYAQMIQDRANGGGRITPQMQEFLNTYNQKNQASGKAADLRKTEKDRQLKGEPPNTEQKYSWGASADTYQAEAAKRQQKLNQFVYGNSSRNPDLDAHAPT